MAFRGLVPLYLSDYVVGRIHVGRINQRGTQGKTPAHQRIYLKVVDRGPIFVKEAVDLDLVNGLLLCLSPVRYPHYRR